MYTLDNIFSREIASINCSNAMGLSNSQVTPITFTNMVISNIMTAETCDINVFKIVSKSKQHKHLLHQHAQSNVSFW